MASFDVVVELIRDDHDQRRRVLRTYARVIAPPDLVYEMTTDGTLQAIGAPADLAMIGVRQRLQSVYGPTCQKTRTLRDRLGDPRPSPAQLLRALQLDARARYIERDPPLEAGDARGRSHRWRLRSANQLHLKEGSGGTSLTARETEVPSAAPRGKDSLPVDGHTERNAR